MRNARMVQPRKPRDESAKTTIALQDNQIRMLVDRCDELTKDRDVWKHDCKQAEEIADTVQHQIKGMDQILRSTESAYARLQGFQDCAREVISMFVKSTGE